MFSLSANVLREIALIYASDERVLARLQGDEVFAYYFIHTPLTMIVTAYGAYQKSFEVHQQCDPPIDLHDLNALLGEMTSLGDEYANQPLPRKNNHGRLGAFSRLVSRVNRVLVRLTNLIGTPVIPLVGIAHFRFAFSASITIAPKVAFLDQLPCTPRRDRSTHDRGDLLSDWGKKRLIQLLDSHSIGPMISEGIYRFINQMFPIAHFEEAAFYYQQSIGLVDDFSFRNRKSSFKSFVYEPTVCSQTLSIYAGFMARGYRAISYIHGGAVDFYPGNACSELYIFQQANDYITFYPESPVHCLESNISKIISLPNPWWSELHRSHYAKNLTNGARDGINVTFLPTVVKRSPTFPCGVGYIRPEHRHSTLELARIFLGLRSGGVARRRIKPYDHYSANFFAQGGIGWDDMYGSDIKGILDCIRGVDVVVLDYLGSALFECLAIGQPIVFIDNVYRIERYETRNVLLCLLDEFGLIAPSIDNYCDNELYYLNNALEAKGNSAFQGELLNILAIDENWVSTWATFFRSLLK